VNKNKKIILVAFGSNNLNKSIKRFQFQAEQSKFYDQIKIFKENDFDQKMNNFILKITKEKKRGFGYWIWKPYFVLKVLEESNFGDIVNYVDIGCHIIGENKKRFNDYLNILNDENVWLLPFQYKEDYKILNNKYHYPRLEEYKFTKSDLFEYYDCLNNKEIINTPQFWAGSFFIKKTENSLYFMKQWLDIFFKRFDLVDDTDSKKENHKDFIENRHDQSVFSILCKKNFITALSAYECDWALFDNKRTWSHNIDSPILAKRDLKYNILKRFLDRQKKNLKRIKGKLIG